MRIAAIQLIIVAAFVIVGWVALWPSRRGLGPFAYHVAALPTGLLAAPVALFVSSVTGRPLDAVSAGVGALVLIALLWVVQFVVLGRKAEGVRVGSMSFLAAGGALVGVGGVLGLLRLTATNYDSISSYWPLGVEMRRTGAFDVIVASSRGALIPSMNAIHVAFGADWAYLVYPLLGATLLLWLGMSLWNGPLAGVGFTAANRTKWLVAGGAVAFLVLEPSYLMNSFMVHSQMISAVYLLIAVTSIWMAVRPDAPDGADVNDAFLILAGAATAGLALSRPDGLAYEFVAVAIAIAALTVSQVRWRSVAAFFGPLLLVVFTVYTAAYLHLGVWKANKLGGKTTLAILIVLALSASGPWLVQLADRLLSIRVRGESFLGVLVPFAAVLMAAALALRWQTAQTALANARINLFGGTGGYYYLWYAVVILFVLAAVSGDALRKGSWTRAPFLGVMLFFVIAGLVHGLSHEGRLGAGDSFNRVVFEILPVVVWFGAAVMARVLGQPAENEPAESDGDAQTG